MRALALSLLLSLLPAAAPTAAPLQYDVEYAVRFDPAAGVGHASISLKPGKGRVNALDLRMPPDRYRSVTGDGKVQRDGDRVHWDVPKTGGTLKYQVTIDHARSSGAFDARLTPDWVIVRGDDLFPPARVRALSGSEASARLRIDLPPGWTDRETGYPRASDGRFIVTNPEQRFDRPVGWIAAGRLVTRSEDMGDVGYRVTGPRDQGVDRVAMLSLLRVATPEVVNAFGTMPKKILIVSAGDPMWRGGLAGPRSLWLHADRKLQSENGTSPLLHELTHTVTGIHGADGDDWIAEGLAEYYSVELSRRAGLLSDKLAAAAIRRERKRGDSVRTLHAKHSTGERTARAVALFADLDAEIKRESNDRHSLDDVVRALMKLDEVSSEDLRQEVEQLIGASKTLEKL